MKNLQLLLHLQRLLDGDLPHAGLDDLEDLGADDLEGARTGDLEDLAPILEELDQMNEQRDAAHDDPGFELDGVEDWLKPGTRPGPARAPAGEGSEELNRLEALLAAEPKRPTGRVRPGAGKGRDPRLQRLMRVLDDVERDGDPLVDDLRRLRRQASSRAATGRTEGRRAPLDPVVLRRRGQIREFLATWRDTLRAARRPDPEDDAAPRSPGPRPVRSADRKTRT